MGQFWDWVILELVSLLVFPYLHYTADFPSLLQASPPNAVIIMRQDKLARSHALRAGSHTPPDPAVLCCSVGVESTLPNAVAC